MNSRPTPSRALAQHLRDWIPVSKEEYKEESKETVQITVWIVALSTGLISVSNLSQSFLAGFTPGAIKWFITLLFATIVFGVLQRILQHLLNHIFGKHILSLYCLLLGRTAEVKIPPEPDLMADRGKIIEAMQEYFGVDYSFLNSYNVPLPGCLEAYKSQYNIWQEAEMELTHWLAEIIAAFSGKPASFGHQLLSENFANFDNIRKKAIRLNIFAWAIFLIFILMVTSFVGAMSVLAWNLMR